jgi:hypothetical protein
MGLFDWLTNSPNFQPDKEIRYYTDYRSNTYEVDDYKYGDTKLSKRKVGDVYQIEVREYESGKLHVEIKKSIGYGGYCKDAEKWFDSFNCDDIKAFYDAVVNTRMNNNISWHASYELGRLNGQRIRDQKELEAKPYRDRLKRCLND